MTKLGRDIKKTLIVDNIPKNFKLQPMNGLEVKTWTGDVFDTHLYDLKQMFITIANTRFDDIRIVIKSIKNQLGNYQNNNPIYKKIVIT